MFLIASVWIFEFLSRFCQIWFFAGLCVFVFVLQKVFYLQNFVISQTATCLVFVRISNLLSKYFYSHTTYFMFLASGELEDSREDTDYLAGFLSSVLWARNARLWLGWLKVEDAPNRITKSGSGKSEVLRKKSTAK